MARKTEKRVQKKAPGRIRTGDLRITNALLYQLSHGSLSYSAADDSLIIAYLQIFGKYFL